MTDTMQVLLTIGKYDQDGRPLTCYDDFQNGSSRILNQFEIVDPFVKAMRKTKLGSLFIVMDEFAGYAAMTAAAVCGYGIGDVAVPLCYYRPPNGVAAYTMM